MGEYANDAIDRACTEEEMRLEYESGDIDFEDAYNYGLVDEKGFSTPSPYSVPPYDEQALRIEISNAMLAFAPTHENLTILTTAKQGAIPQSLIETCQRYQKTWEMRLGMAKTLRESGHSLSIKQRAWIQTNWKGGYKAFVETFGPTANKKTSDKVFADLRKLASLINRIAKSDSQSEVKKNYWKRA